MFSLLQFDPLVTIALGPLRVSPHGIATALGFFAGARLLLPTTRRRGVADDVVFQMLYRAAVGALIGARLAYVVNHWSEYADAPLSVFAVWEGGISLFGGLVGGVLAAIPVMRARRLSFWSLMDAAAPGLALGIAIGRVGDLVVGDHLGRPTDIAVGFRCTGADTASRCAAPVGDGVHLPALYDLVSVSTLLVALLVLRRRPRWDGFLIVVFAAWYGTGRFVEDFFRIDDPVAIGLSGSQLTALSLVVLADGWLALGRRTPRFDTAPPPTAADPVPAGSERP